MSRALWITCSLLVMVYSIAVLAHVAWMGTIGVRCMFGTKIEEEIPPDYNWLDERPHVGDSLLSIGQFQIRDDSYSDYIRALRGLGDLVGQTVDARWTDAATGATHSSRVEVQYPPTWTYFWSCVWFLQELLIFAIGARVFWKRPDDASARIFFVMCIVTVGAYMGGYHWTEIVGEPWLIYPFVAFAVFVPVVNLHFYLEFPRPNPLLQRRQRLVLLLLYGAPLAYLAALWSTMLLARYLGGIAGLDQATAVFRVLRSLALGYIGVASLLFIGCVLCIGWSFRNARNRSERSQVQWIFLASLIALFLIGYVVEQAWRDPASLGRDNAAWPMFGVSLLYTMAHAFSITRYKLMQVEEIVNRGVVYFALSLAAGITYSCLLLVSGKLIGDQLFATHATSRGAMTAAVSAIFVLILSEVVRGRFQRVIDRQFFREKYKFDRAMQKMRMAVGSLIDRGTLGRRLLEAAAEVLRLEWGALYLGDAQGRGLALTASYGPAPDEQLLRLDHPLAQRLQTTPTLRLSHPRGLAGSSDPATDAMIALGGEAAAGLGGDGGLAGVLVLGPKTSGMPYEDEELAFLGALGSVATLVLHSADIQQTLERLNHELRNKVEKIAEQQRRILVLQDQLKDRAIRRRESEGLQPPQAASSGEPQADEHDPFESIKGRSPSVSTMIVMARKVAASSSAVLIRGESGTGKELLAAAIHAASPRAGRHFVKVHCAALSQNLLESELFGHVRGAFTGADRDRIGRFEQADQGTLFLDEIGDVNLEVQTKLLRVLQESTFERVGSSQPVKVDVRILAATHQNLEELIATGRFREDLYYRLNVIHLPVPTLRERKEDILDLALHFLRTHGRKTGKLVTHLDPETVSALLSYPWPGNIRELENVMERAIVMADGPAVVLADLPPEIRQPRRLRPRARSAATYATGAGAHTFTTRAEAMRGDRSSYEEPLSRNNPAHADDWNSDYTAYEIERLRDALREAGGNKSTAARLLGMPRSTFFSKLRKHGLA